MEHYGLRRDQIQRASVSVMANIAEGFDAGSDTEFVRFLGYSLRSATEVHSHLYVALDQRYIPSNAKQRYVGQWLAFLVTEESPTGELFGQVIAHDLDRRELHRQLREKKVKQVYVTFAGLPVKPGYAVIL